MNLLRLEVRRALRRRAVIVLLALAVVGCVVFGAAVLLSSAGEPLAQLRSDAHPAVVASWWDVDRSEGLPQFASLFLIVGAVIAGAAVAGGEWKYGTVTAALTWEPRRHRLLAARFGAAALVAGSVAIALQLLLMLAAFPGALANGSTATPGRGWWGALALAVLRAALLTIVAALIAEAIATVGRSTAAGVIATFVWVAVLEGLVRGLRPRLARFLWAENVATVLPWASPRTEEFQRGPLTALVTIGIYVTAFLVVAFTTFQRRDVAGAT